MDGRRPRRRSRGARHDVSTPEPGGVSRASKSVLAPGMVLTLGTALALGAAIALPGAVHAQEDDGEEPGWYWDAELTLVFTAGNSASSTVGAAAGIRRLWETTEFRLRAGGMRTESGRISRTAVGTPAEFEVVEATDRELTAENYFVRTRLARDLSERFFVYGGAGWERNTFAGFDARSSFAAGAGNTWLDGEETRLLTDYALTYTIQEDVIDDPGTADSFAGLRVSAEFFRRLTGTTGFLSELVLDENLSETEDLRADFTNSVQIEVSEALALRTSLQLLYDNLPSLTTVDLEQPAGTPTGETVQVPLDELDTRLSIALVASF